MPWSTPKLDALRERLWATPIPDINRLVAEMPKERLTLTLSTYEQYHAMRCDPCLITLDRLAPDSYQPRHGMVGVLKIMTLWGDAYWADVILEVSEA